MFLLHVINISQLAAELLHSVDNWKWRPPPSCIFLEVQSGNVHHLELLFGNSRRPAQSTYDTYQISCWSTLFFSRYLDLKILQISIKVPIPAPKICFFFEFEPLNVIFIVKTQKGTSLAGNKHIEPSLVALRCFHGVMGTWSEEYKNG